MLAHYALTVTSSREPHSDEQLELRTRPASGASSVPLGCLSRHYEYKWGDAPSDGASMVHLRE